VGAGRRAVARDSARGRSPRRPRARGLHRRHRALDAEPDDGREHARVRGSGPAPGPSGGRAAVSASRHRGSDAGDDPQAGARADRRVLLARGGRPVPRVRRSDERALAAVHARPRRGALGGPPPLERGVDAGPRELRGRPREAGAGRRGKRRARRRDRARPRPAPGRARRLGALVDAPPRPRGRRDEPRGDRREHQADALGRAPGAARPDRAGGPRARVARRSARGGPRRPCAHQAPRWRRPCGGPARWGRRCGRRRTRPSSPVWSSPRAP